MKLAITALLALLLLATAAGCTPEKETMRWDPGFDEATATSLDDPEAILALYEGLRERPGDPFSGTPLLEEERFLLFASAFAHLAAPYGTSVKIELNELLVEPRLDCDNYVALTLGLLEEYRRRKKTDEVRFRIVGWHGGAVGNHAQFFSVRKNGPPAEILFDPTVGLAARASFNEVASGRPIAPPSIIDYSSRTDLAEYRVKVRTALTGGLYRPLDLLYFFERPQRFLASPDPQLWPTPGAVRMRREAARPKTL